MQHIDIIYLNLLMDIIKTGHSTKDRTGVGTLSTFGKQIEIDMTVGFPLLTTKRLHFHSIKHELYWFLRGDTNIKYLTANKVRIWDEWADINGNLGPVYGKQWRNYGGSRRDIDQIRELLKGMNENPESRRHIVTAWNPADLPDMALPPCHCLFQLYIRDNTISLKLYQRSADAFLGLPFNIASYALLLHVIARQYKLTPHRLIITFGDLHLYKNHISQAEQQIERINHVFCLPTLDITAPSELVYEWRPEDTHLVDYEAHPHIKAEVAI